MAKHFIAYEWALQAALQALRFTALSPDSTEAFLALDTLSNSLRLADSYSDSNDLSKDWQVQLTNLRSQLCQISDSKAL